MSLDSHPSRRILVDMTPLAGNGQNGGAGLVAVNLVQHLSALAPELQFTLLTAEASHAELEPLDRPNVERQCIVSRARARTLARQLVDTLLPPRARVGLKRTYRSLRTSRQQHRLTDDLQPSLHFYPFTVPYFWSPGTPTVSIVYDLQHVTYPQFFTAEQRLNRQHHLQDACTRSNQVICISEYVRGTLLAGFDVRPERVSTIRLGLLRNTVSTDPAAIDRLELCGADFLLYPANFWPHKNHRVLFEALSLYRRAHPDSRLRLVCTGAPNALMSRLEVAANALMPPGTVVFAGYLLEQELSALVAACRGVVFPSLYEGFGMPVLEAMAAGKPILCSNVTSLPEVAGDAAIYFDPTSPRQIAEAIDLLSETGRVARLVSLGQKRAESMGDGRDMAARYLDVFEQVLAGRG